MHFPLWFVLLLAPVVLWPAFLAAAAAAAVVAARMRGRARVAASAAAVLLAAGPLFAACHAVLSGLEDRRFGQEYAATHSVLAAETTLDGLVLPAGTDVTWENATRTRFIYAAPPRPADVLGLPATTISRNGEEWVLSLAGPRTLDGWPCDGFSVSVARDGHLRSCLLSEAVDWRDWALPRHTSVSPRPDGRLGLRLPDGADMSYPGLGQPLPEEVVANADGSLHTADFLREPLVIRGVQLVRVVAWRYAPETEGEGRGRPAVAVAGTTDLSATPDATWRDPVRVIVRLSDGTITREPGGENRNAAAPEGNP